MPSYRKKWDGQIRSINEIGEGMVIVVCHTGVNWDQILRVKELKKELFCATRADGIKTDNYYGDCNLKRYGLNNWNPSNYVRRPTTKELIEFKRKEKPKQEDNVEKDCKNCDFSRNREWNNHDGCWHTMKNPCLLLSNWKLRRDYNQENKEQEMYKPTSKCTLKNIAHFIDHDGCNEARKIFGDIILKHIMGYDVPRSKDIIKKDSLIWEAMMSSRENSHWLKDNRYIEEELILKPCPFCGGDVMEVSDTLNQAHAECQKCGETWGDCGKMYASRYEKWNTRKQ